MKSYELKPCEVGLVVRALRFAGDYAAWEVDERKDIGELLQKLDPQPVQKNAWIVVYDDESRSRLFDWESEAQKWASHAPNAVKVVRVTWEE